jgi:hypothetical protein
MNCDPETVIKYYAKRLDKGKWEITNQTENGIQIREIKRVNRLGIWSGLFLLPFWGFGLVLWLLTLLDYALQRERIKFITIDIMVEELKAAK